MSEEIVKGVVYSDLDRLNNLSTKNGWVLNVFKECFKELAGNHAKAVLEDYIKTHSAKSDTVSTTYPLETKFKVGCGDDFYTFDCPPFGKIKVQRWPEFGGKEPNKKDDYGRVYSDLEGQGDKGSPAKNEDLIEKMRTTSFPFTMANEFLEEFANSDRTSSAKTEVPRETHKNKYGIGQKVFVINQNEISECVIQDISDGEDGIEYVAYDDYGCDFKLMEKEVITTIEQLVNYVKKLAQTFK